jgi:hypothetical protein
MLVYPLLNMIPSDVGNGRWQQGEDPQSCPAPFQLPSLTPRSKTPVQTRRGGIAITDLLNDRHEKDSNPQLPGFRQMYELGVPQMQTLSLSVSSAYSDASRSTTTTEGDFETNAAMSNDGQSEYAYGVSGAGSSSGTYYPRQYDYGQQYDQARLSLSAESGAGPSSMSVSDASSVQGSRQADRPTYETEELFYMWYMRDDLNMHWKDVQRSFEEQFPDRPKRAESGLQCRYYRFTQKRGVPGPRDRRKIKKGESSPYGVIAWAIERFPWMRTEDQAAQCRKSFL